MNKSHKPLILFFGFAVMPERHVVAWVKICTSCTC